MLYESKSHIAIPPGEEIKEELEYRKITQKEFAARMGLSEKHISKLINGEVQLTVDVAMRLEMVLGAPAQFWCALESKYREELIRVNEENAIELDADIAKKVPYTLMAEYGWVPVARKQTEKVINLRKFFEVAKLTFLHESLLPTPVGFKVNGLGKKEFEILSWLQKAKLDARNADLGYTSARKLVEAIPKIRALTTEKPETFKPKLTLLLAECGVALVFLPPLGTKNFYGATFADGNRVVLALTLQDTDIDAFWYNFFYEISNIVCGRIGNVKSPIKVESDSTEFAKSALIPTPALQKYLEEHNFTKVSMKEFADEIGIDVGIVVGILQKDGYIDKSDFNELKSKYILSA